MTGDAQLSKFAIESETHMQVAYAPDTEFDWPAIEVRALRKVYRGGVEAVKGIDFDVASGEVFGLLGPNAAGKSTTIGMLTTTVVPTSGCARLAGYDVVKEPRKARSVSSVVFQEAVVDGGLSGRANLDLHARLWGVPAATAATRIDELIEAFGVAELIDRPVESFSGGQRRRLEIARALVSQPQVLFLDEPTVGLDPRIRHELLDVIAALRSRRDTTILLTTHYLDEARRLCDRVAIIHQGEIAALDTPASLLAGLGPEILELRLDGDGDAALASLRSRGIATTDAFAIGSSLTIALDGRPAGEAIAAITDAGVRASGFMTRPPTLDDVYLRLTGAPIAQAA
ncbi:MAG TPA: ATP-binding cassette domain-containing protein [Solirubrobacteraceae bacterium]|nr:ATP-binding cassette domain-containing protein [Solirubrobacteraceae bacterium]